MGNEIITGPTLLYVDDQPSHLALFQKAFQRDYRVLIAYSGEEGLEIIKNNRVFLAIADHNMPRMSGVDFLQKVEEMTPRTEQALLSAYTDEKIIKEAGSRTRVREYLKKPWKLESMKALIDLAFQRYEIEPTSQVPENFPASGQRLMPFLLEHLKESVDRAGVRRIFLNHVEPPLKKFVPPIRRPTPELLRQAQEEALRGNYEGVQKILAAYFQSLERHQSASEENLPVRIFN